MTTFTASADRSRQIRRVLWVVLVLNLVVALAKLFYGIVSHSAAMEADGFHSLFDGASNIIGLIGMWFASRPADEGHPYGHAKFETVAAAVIGILLAFAGYTVGKGAIDSLTGTGVPTEVTTISFAIMLGTLAINLFVTTWERRAGRRLGSEILVADASHTLSDVMVSSGVIVSLILVKVGFEAADGVVALLVAVVIFHTAWGIFRGVLHTLGDAARLSADEVAAVAAHGARRRGGSRSAHARTGEPGGGRPARGGRPRDHGRTRPRDRARRRGRAAQGIRADHRRSRASGARGHRTDRHSSGWPATGRLVACIARPEDS